MRTLRQAFVRADGLHDLLADGEHRVERGHRLLEHHGDAGAADALHAGIGEAGEVFAGEADFAGGDACGRLRQQAHDGEGGDALAAAGLADDAEDFAFVEGEGDILDGGDLAARGGEGGGEVATESRGIGTKPSPSPCGRGGGRGRRDSTVQRWRRPLPLSPSRKGRGDAARGTCVTAGSSTLGSSTSRSPSPSRFSPSTVIISAAPGW